MHELDDVKQAIRNGWSAETIAGPQQWTEQNRALGQCEVSSFVAWEYLGGDLVHGEVFINDEMTENHWWNRIDGLDIDLTEEQFSGVEDIRIVQVIPHDVVEARQSDIKPEMRARMRVLRAAVANQIGEPRRF